MCYVRYQIIFVASTQFGARDKFEKRNHNQKKIKISLKIAQILQIGNANGKLKKWKENVRVQSTIIKSYYKSYLHRKCVWHNLHVFAYTIEKEYIFFLEIERIWGKKKAQRAKWKQKTALWKIEINNCSSIF